MSRYHESDIYLLNAIRALLGMCPLPMTAEARIDKQNAAHG